MRKRSELVREMQGLRGEGEEGYGRDGTGGEGGGKGLGTEWG